MSTGLCVFMDGAVFKLRRPAPEKAQFRVGPKAAMLNPAAQKEIFSRNPERYGFACGRSPLHRQAPPTGALLTGCVVDWLSTHLIDFLHQFWFRFFIRIQAQNPIPACLFDGGVFLRGEAPPGFDEHL